MAIAAATRCIPGTSVQRFLISGLDLRINAETTVSGGQFTYCNNDLPQANHSSLRQRKFESGAAPLRLLLLQAGHSDLAPRRAGREPAKEQSLLLPHAPKQITAHKTEIYPSDTQAIRILTPARWHQFDLTAQHQNLYLAHNQYVRKSRHAK